MFHLQPPTSKILVAFPVFALKNHLYIVSCQFNLATSFCYFVCFWLISGAPHVAAHTKSEMY